MIKSLILLAALGLFAATPALAAKGDARIGLQFCGSLPTGDFSKTAKPGFEIGLVGTYMQSEHGGIGVDAAYHAWNGSDDLNALAVSIGGPGSEFKFSAIQTTAHALYDFRPGEKASPYAKAGFGVYWVKDKFVNPQVSTSSSTEAKFGYNLGAGISFNVSPGHAIDIGGMYHIIDPSDSAANLVTVGVNLMRRVRAK